MSDYAELKKLLRQKPYIVADVNTNEVRLVTEPTALRLLAEAGPFVTESITHIRHTLETFSRLPNIGKNDKEFGLKEIAEIMGTTYENAYYYTREKVFTPSIRNFGGGGQGDCEGLFSWGDAFTAGVIGVLRRNGLRLKGLRKVQPLLSANKKRTPRKPTTPARS